MFFYIFLLEYNRFTTLCWFLLYKVIQPYVHISMKRVKYVRCASLPVLERYEKTYLS